MSQTKRYRFNRETLTYEIHKTPISMKFLKTSAYFVSSLIAFALYIYIYTNVLGFETPKYKILKKHSTEWSAKLQILNNRFEKNNKVLEELQMRDNIVYRSIFGMEEISSDIRNAGYGGVDRFSYLENVDHSGLLTSTAEKINILYKKAYVQSKSFDEVALLAQKAGEMALSVPNISPVVKENVRFSSGFGYRIDPILRNIHRMHSGIDLSGRSGEPIYVTGNGIVKQIGFDFFGYGNFIIVDHGFGYKTRYAHLRGMLVKTGQVVRRGDQIGEMGDSGRSNGTHLHYEVIYKNNPVNPINYYNNDISSEDYASIIKPSKILLSDKKRWGN